MPTLNRRRLLAGAGAAGLVAGAWPHVACGWRTTEPNSPNDRWRIGAIGMRYQGSVVTRAALAYGDVVAICDVDRHVREQARASFNSAAAIYEDYRDLLARDDVDVVIIGTPDHWHAKMLIDACRAGKDVYCEKPLSLTIDEGKLVRRIVDQTGRVVQIGSWQRSDARFRLAVELVHAGRIGSLRTVTIVMGKNAAGGPFERAPAPKNLNWDRWLGQAPDVPYVAERCHYSFRYWLEYAGGEMSDNGAHDLDIAQWAIGAADSGPVEVTGEGTFPSIPDGYNVPTYYHAVYRYANGVEMEVLDRPRGQYDRAGIMFEGAEGRIFVNRSTLAGKPVEDLAHHPLAATDYKLYKCDNLDRPQRTGKLDAIHNHLGNFFDCLRSRELPLSDVASQHRSATVCHLGNIAIRLGKTLSWDPGAEQFLGPDASGGKELLSRPQRAGYEVA